MSKRPADTSTNARPIKKSKPEKPKEEKKLKRSVPVTATKQIEAEEQEDAWEDEQVESKNTNNPEQLRLQRKEQKALLNSRKAQKANYDILSAAKPQWNQLLLKSNTPQERKKLATELMTIVHGHIKELCTKHDASRIVQALVKYGSTAERQQVASELEGTWPHLVRGRYSKFLVLKLIRLLPSHRRAIIQAILPLNKSNELQKLIVHREASTVLADTFELYANALEKEEMVRGFWGKEVALFASNDQDKDKIKQGLQGILTDLGEVERRKRVLREVATALQTVFANPEKAAATHAIVHRALWEYLDSISKESNVPEMEEQDRLRRELFESIQDALPELVHTKDGSRSVREFFAWATPKDRKTIIKLLKSHFPKMTLNEEAQLVLFTMIDTMDDTTHLNRSLLPALIPNSTQDPPLHTTPTGRRSLLYPLIGRCTRHLTPALISNISDTDWIKKDKGRSKKDDSIRQGEIIKNVSPGWVEWIEKSLRSAGKDQNNVIRDPGGCLVLGEVLLSSESSDKSKLHELLLAPLLTPYPSSSLDEPHILTNTPATRLYKSLLQGGHYNHQTSTLIRVDKDIWNRKAFARTFFTKVGKDRVVEMCTQGDREGTWLIVSAAETLLSSEDTVNDMDVDDKEKDQDAALRQQLKGWFSKDVQQTIQSGEGRGKGVLLEVLGRL